MIPPDVAAELAIPYNLTADQSDDLKGRLAKSPALRRALAQMLADIGDGSPVVDVQ